MEEVWRPSTPHLLYLAHSFASPRQVWRLSISVYLVWASGQILTQWSSKKDVPFLCLSTLLADEVSSAAAGGGCASQRGFWRTMGQIQTLGASHKHKFPYNNTTSIAYLARKHTVQRPTHSDRLEQDKTIFLMCCQADGLGHVNEWTQ